MVIKLAEYIFNLSNEEEGDKTTDEGAVTMII